MYSIALKKFRPIQSDRLVTNHRSKVAADHSADLLVNTPVGCINIENKPGASPRQLRNDHGPHDPHSRKSGIQPFKFTNNVQVNALPGSLGKSLPPRCTTNTSGGKWLNAANLHNWFHCMPHSPFQVMCTWAPSPKSLLHGDVAA